MNTFSALDRSTYIDQLKDNTFDLLIIGGGITGAGIALDAATRGLKVALVEKLDFASGTSGRSTKLIHGGLRYLKQLDIGLVREVGSERAIVHKLAPHLVTPEKMLLPLIENGTYGYFATSLGLKVYDVLAGVEGDDRRTMLSREEAIKKEPLLRKDFLKGAGYYAEYRTDDARLTIEVMKTAVRHGAVCLNYCKATKFIYEQDKVIGAACLDEFGQQAFDIKSRFIVSAAGPWVDNLRKKDKSLSGKHLFHSKGVHLVVPKERFPLQQAVYFDVPDGRMMFAIPRQTITYIGTTDTKFEGDINRIRTNQKDVDYLLDGVNNMFPDVKLNYNDILSTWAGVRPLIHETGKSASELSRKDEIFESPSGLISIAGGKLTGYRKMAERIVDLVAKRFCKQFDKDIPDCKTDAVVLMKDPLKDTDEVHDFCNKEILAKVKAKGLKAEAATYLVLNYGKNATTILDNMKATEMAPEIALALSELHFGIHYEMVLHPNDFFVRRTGRLFFNIDSVYKLKDLVLDEMRKQFQLPNELAEKYAAEIELALEEATHFPVDAVKENV